MRIAIYERDYPFHMCGFRNAEYKTLHDLDVDFTIYCADSNLTCRQNGWPVSDWSPVPQHLRPASCMRDEIKDYDIIYTLDDYNFSAAKHQVVPDSGKPHAVMIFPGFRIWPGGQLDCDMCFSNVEALLSGTLGCRHFSRALGYADFDTVIPPPRERLIFGAQVQVGDHKGLSIFTEFAKDYAEYSGWEVVLILEPPSRVPPGPWKHLRMMSTDKYVEFLKEGGVFFQTNMPGSHDPFPNGSCLEAMIVGLPIVATHYSPNVFFGDGVCDFEDFETYYCKHLDELREAGIKARESRRPILDRFVIMKDKLKQMEIFLEHWKEDNK